MNYNTEDIQRIAEAVAKMVQEGISQKESERQEVQTLAAYELAFREVLRQIGAQALVPKKLKACTKNKKIKAEKQMQTPVVE